MFFATDQIKKLPKIKPTSFYQKDYIKIKLIQISAKLPYSPQDTVFDSSHPKKGAMLIGNSASWELLSSLIYRILVHNLN